MSVPGSKAASPPRSAPLKKKRTPRPPAAHPAYAEMIRSAIATLKERGGSSRHKILGYVRANYEVGNEQTKINARVRTALKSGVEKGVLLRNAKGTGANGSFRVGKALPKKKGKAPRKKGKTAKKSKKTARKRSPKKSAKKAAKKPKKAAKKATKRKARKSPTKKRSPKKKAKPAARRPKAKAAKGKAKGKARR